MSTEITRASDKDRDRAQSHLRELYAQGYVNDAELELMTTRIFRAQLLTDLRIIFTGLPQVPALISSQDARRAARILGSGTGALLSLMLAIVPSVAGETAAHGTAKNLIEAITIPLGVIGTIIFICITCYLLDPA